MEYASYDDMKNAMKKLDGSELNGRKIKLTEDYRGRKRRYKSSILLNTIMEYLTPPFVVAQGLDHDLVAEVGPAVVPGNAVTVQGHIHTSVPDPTPGQDRRTMIMTRADHIAEASPGAGNVTSPRNGVEVEASLEREKTMERNVQL